MLTQPTIRPLRPDEPVSVTMTAQDWNIVIEGLCELKFRIANPVLRQITDQVQAHMNNDWEAHDAPDR
jgi:hypothetical protein